MDNDNFLKREIIEVNGSNPIPSMVPELSQTHESIHLTNQGFAPGKTNVWPIPVAQEVPTRWHHRRSKPDCRSEEVPWRVWGVLERCDI